MRIISSFFSSDGPHFTSELFKPIHNLASPRTADWEIGKDVLICKTCGLTLPAKITVDDHHMLHWQKHER